MPAPARVRTAEESCGYGSAFAEYEAFEAALGHSLAPRGSGLLWDLVAELGLPPGSLAVDVGAREASHGIELSRPVGFTVTASSRSAATWRVPRGPCRPWPLPSLRSPPASACTKASRSSCPNRTAAST